MRILLDTCMSDTTLRTLVEAGFDVVWSGSWTTDPGDEELLSFALREKRILVTLDKDFGELVVLKRRPHAGVLRLVEITASEQAMVCLAALRSYGAELERSGLVTVERRRVRVRPPESND